MKLTDTQIASILGQEEYSALDFEGELSKKRAKLMDYYNAQPFGDEIEGQSSAVTTDVADVIEWMIPSLLRTFTQSKIVGKFTSHRIEDEQEAKDKTHLSNYCFLEENDGVLTLHNMFKDALLQFTGVVKVTWQEQEKTSRTTYKGLSELELEKLRMMPGVRLESVEYEEIDGIPYYDAEVVETSSYGKVCYDNIPTEEFLISRTARDFKNPRFIGHRSPKTRSELLEMGFDKDIVQTLPKYDQHENSEEKAARYHDYSYLSDSNPSTHEPNDIIYLGEYYIYLDADGDGITELWKVFYAGDKILEKEQVEEHPFAVGVPVPIPHRAIGSCPAEQVADIQYRKSHLVRQMLNNIYQSNYPRIAHSNKVDLDDLLTPRAGGSIEVDTDAGDVAGHTSVVTIPDMTDGILRGIEYTDTEREIRTGITRYSQGLDGEALNKTATGFKGIMDASQQRLDMIARLFAEGGVKEIFEKTVRILAKYQDTPMQIKLLGEPLEINPATWGDNTKCRIDVGLGSGDRQEKIVNLNNILMHQKEFMMQGLVLADQAKIFNTMEKLIDEIGLKSAEEYFNNPEMPEQTLMAQLQNAQNQLQILEQQVQQNPLAEAELIKAQAKMAEAQGKSTNEMQRFVMEMAMKDDHFRKELARELTELELKYNQDVPGSQV